MNKLYYFLYFLFFTMFSTVGEARENSILLNSDYINQSTPQVISFNAFSEKRYGDGDFLLTATSSSGLEVTYSSADTSIAEVYKDSNDGNRWKLKINAAGSVIITAYQAGNEFFDKAVPVSQTLEITKSPQTITWTQSLITGCSGETQIVLDATASSGLPIQYSSSNLNVATVNGNILTINTAGYSDIKAHQLGNQNYLETDTIRKLNVRLIGKVKQKWNDVLVFDNTTNKYVSWQWYRDNSILTGATRQYYTSAPVPLSGTYHTVVEDTDRNFMETCPFNVLDGISKGGIKVTPNPSPRNGSIKIVLDYTEEELKGARLLIVDLTGNIYREFTMVSPEINIPAPSNPNMYIIYLYFPTGDKTTVKLLVN
ncbi:hypothetical protein [Chishuiella changwenlii]|uniref:hypothetical protein n=1 Tax=Chishuiella changwenlii TaxID=1434701 RepID=UPI002FDAD3D2